MSNIFITPALTIAGGLVLFGLTQCAQRFFLDPVADLRKALGRTAFVAIYYANVYASAGVNPPDDMKREAERERRKCASELSASLWAVQCYWLFHLVKQLPSKKDVKQIGSVLMGLSNQPTRAEFDELKRLLGI
jgi:hypothetical protein